MLIALLMLVQAAAVPAPVDIVVQGSKWKCKVVMADRAVTNRELDTRLRALGDTTPVRVFAPAGTDLKCMLKITNKLADRGVKLVEFVDPNDPRQR